MTANVKWMPQNVRNMVLEVLDNNAETAAHFILDNARQRFRSITTPDTPRDRAYRNFLYKYMFAYNINKVPNGREIEIGLKVGQTGTSGVHHHGFFIEIGSKSAPSHPYLRPAVFGNAAEITQLWTGE